MSSAGRESFREFVCRYCGGAVHVPRVLTRPRDLDPVEPLRGACGTCGTLEGHRAPPGHPLANVDPEPPSEGASS